MDAQTLTRAEMRYYRFGFDHSTESSVFGKTGCPNKLAIAMKSGLITREQLSEATQVLQQVIEQAVADFDPSHASTHGENERGKYCLFHADMVWSGTAERVVSAMRVYAYKTQEMFETGPLPTHEHGDGGCVLGEEGECGVWSRQEEVEHRQMVLQDRERMTDPTHLDTLLDLLEEQHVLIPLTGTDLEDFFEGKRLLEPPSNVTLRNVSKKEKNEHLNVGGTQGIASLPDKEEPETVVARKPKSPGLKKKESPPAKEFGLLSDAAVESCLAAGIDRNDLRFLGTRSGCADTLNNPENTNTPAAARTIIKRAWFEPQCKQWLAKHP
jgi:hypothetical protein